MSPLPRTPRSPSAPAKWDSPTDTHLGNDTSAAGGWSISVDTAGFPAGDNVFFAVARDDLNALSLVRKATGVVNVAPTIGNVAASPSPVLQNQDLTLTAQGVADTLPGTVVAVQFFRETNSAPGLQVGTGGDANIGNDTDGTDGWAIVRGTGTVAPGTHTFYARARDNNNALSNVVSVNVEVQAEASTVTQATLTSASTDKSTESLTSAASSDCTLQSRSTPLREVEYDAVSLLNDEDEEALDLTGWETWINSGGVRLAVVA